MSVTVVTKMFDLCIMANLCELIRGFFALVDISCKIENTVKMASVSICRNLQKSFLYNVRKSARFASGYFLHTSAGFRSAEEPHILKCPSGDVPLSKLPFGDYLWSNVQKHKSRTALVRHYNKFGNL